MIRITSRGTYKRTKHFLESLLRNDQLSDLDQYGRLGVEALSAATPVDTGTTSESWDYRIKQGRNWVRLEWFNTNRIEPGGPSVAILLEHGHGTRGGTYVSGHDYINPAMKPVFDEIIRDMWKKVMAA